jgi:CRP/FNR family transcriptional regulator, cyclic AMP receptor protein
MGGGMAAQDVMDQLAKVPLFSSCSKKELQSVARSIKVMKHPAGAVIAAEGDPGRGLFILGEGDADVTVGGKKVNELHAGDSFGEMALLDGGPRTATVTATTPVKIFALSEWAFRGVLADQPAIAMRTLEAMAGRLREAAMNPS